MISYLKQKSDLIGALASFVCMVHCMITPFLFIATVCSSSCCASAPWWWVWLDFFFLLISFFAVYKSTQNSSKPWMKIALWIAWGALFSAILMEQSSFQNIISTLRRFCLLVCICTIWNIVSANPIYVVSTTKTKNFLH